MLRGRYISINHNYLYWNNLAGANRDMLDSIDTTHN